MTLGEVRSLIQDSVQIGVMQAIKTYEPVKDYVRAKEIRDWLKINNIDFSLFKKLENSGLISSKRVGEGRNSPIVYSKAEVKKAIQTHTICCFMADGKITNEK